MAINVTATVSSVIINLAINFFLTPYIVSRLGVSAYGFVGLASNIIGYSQLITIALNSMAGRFITIKYAQGNIDEANEYFSSVFYSNLFLSAAIILVFGIGIIYIDSYLDIPENLVFDVKCLCSLLLCNTIIGLMTNVYAVATFIKNRLELGAIRNMIGNMVRAMLVFSFFYLFVPKLWYIGLASLVSTTYVSFTNYKFKQRLTPALLISKYLFSLKKVKELLISGLWNLISKLGDLLQRGFDLLFANIFIGASEMGILSLTTFVPYLILLFFSTISSNFAPILTVAYANGDIIKITHELHKSIRLMSVVLLVPLSVLYVYGDVFYSLWIPSQNSILLYHLTICGTFALFFTLPFESFWNLFMVTNKIKYSSLYVLFNSIAVFVTVVGLLMIVDDSIGKMFVIASTKSIWGVFRGIFFLPIYGAKCLNLKWNYFYKYSRKPVVVLIVGIIALYQIRLLFMPDGWISFFVASVIIALLSLTMSMTIILSSEERHALIAILRKK